MEKHSQLTFDFVLIWFNSISFSAYWRASLCNYRSSTLSLKRGAHPHKSHYSSHLIYKILSFFKFLFSQFFKYIINIIHHHHTIPIFFPFYPCDNTRSFAILFITPSYCHRFQIIMSSLDTHALAQIHKEPTIVAVNFHQRWVFFADFSVNSKSISMKFCKHSFQLFRRLPWKFREIWMSI